MLSNGLPWHICMHTSGLPRRMYHEASYPAAAYSSAPPPTVLTLSNTIIYSKIIFLDHCRTVYTKLFSSMFLNYNGLALFSESLICSDSATYTSKLECRSSILRPVLLGWNQI